MIFLQSEGVNNPRDIDNIIDRKLLNAEKIKTKTGELYYNVSCSFDIEVSSFYEEISGQSEKRCLMYEWTLGLHGEVIIGRTWEDAIKCFSELIDKLELGEQKRLIIYIHNLAYEFQFMAKRFLWEKVFSLRERKPVYARTFSGLEFRCSYILSGYSLDELGKHLIKYPCKKLVGNLDYNKIRHANTPLTETELKYCENDARVVMSYIQERIEIDGDITQIPLTKTGYVRAYCRQKCLYGEGSRKTPENINRYYRYRDKMKNMTIEAEEYQQLKRAFQGGFTHASSWKAGKLFNNVGSIDFTSSYPAVMISEKFPSSKAELIEIDSKDAFYKNLKLYCCIFDIEFTELQEKNIIEHPLSLSRCRSVKNEIVDNGRIVSAEHLITTLTEQDFFIIEQFYGWKTAKVGHFRRYRKDYLPRDFVKAILDLYKQKTELKGVEGQEIEYLRSKEMLNSCYGMSVTDIVRDEIVYNDEWGKEKAEVEKSLNKYNNSKNRFLFYPWGVWVTAYARKNLFTGINAFGSDYIYSDTDSIKAINMQKHMDYIKGYNNHIVDKLETALYYHGFPLELIRPKSKDGKEKILGVWDYEGEYILFKTLGAKRYLTYKDNKLSMTVSGLNKKVATPYLLELAGGDVEKAFKLFDDNLYIPKGKTGKNIHTYIDNEMKGIVIDYLGTPIEYYEKSGIHMEPADYSLSLSRAYADYLRRLTTYFD